MGKNDRNQKYDDIELIFRDASHIDRFIEKRRLLVTYYDKLLTALLPIVHPIKKFFYSKPAWHRHVVGIDHFLLADTDIGGRDDARLFPTSSKD